MLKIENTEVTGWRAAVRGARNPMNSWNKADSNYYPDRDYSCCVELGPNDLRMLKNLANAGPDHGKYLRMITVTADVTAPLYWWKEADQYKISTVTNSCSTMHKIHAEPITMDDFSHEHLNLVGMNMLKILVDTMEANRRLFLESKDKKFWWQMIQLLPTSYNQRRTYYLNYAVLRNMYHARKNHKLTEWHDFCDWIRTLPYAAELIIGGDSDEA